MPDPTIAHWILIAIAAAGIGFSKAGFPGVSMLHVVVFALVFGPIASTGILLPMLVVGDLCAITMFGRRAEWSHICRLLPAALLGVVLGWYLMDRLNPTTFRWVVGGTILVLAAVQGYRMFVRPLAEVMDPPPAGMNRRAWTLAIVLGLIAGMTTMMANAAGPVVAMYLLVVRLPKWELIGTAAWLFLVLNVVKLPFSYNLGLIDRDTLRTGAMLAPIIPLGMFAGRWLVHRVSQRAFNAILLIFTAVMAIRLIM